MAEDFCFVSCDIIGHSIEQELAVQKRRVQDLNDIVRETRQATRETAIWASGGDGGHVAFPLAGGATAAINLIARLHAWSMQENLPLRITGHVGSVVRTSGADGRIQLVGDGINVCGSLLDFGAAKSVIVSEPFRDLIENADIPGITFKDDRIVYLKHFSSRRVFLMDIEGEVDSQWSEPSKSEYALLDEAMEHKLPWNTIYHAKRLLQANTEDARATKALEAVAKGQLGPLTAKNRFKGEMELNRLLDRMDPKTFYHFATNTELVERDNAEFFCHVDDEGDTMFVVLTGEIGVVVEPSKKSPEPRGEPRDVRFGPGHLVGELAYALRRRRVASLQAIGSTAVLAFDYEKLKEVFRRSQAPEMIQNEHQSFLAARTLEYLCNHAHYLIGPDGTGPLASISQPWSYMERGHTETFHRERNDKISAEDEHFARQGLYILASGELKNASKQSRPTKSLDGHSLPIVYADFPGALVYAHHEYSVQSQHAVVVWIRDHAFVNIGDTEYDQTIAGLKRALGAQFAFDVFLAYNSSDHNMAARWYEALERENLSVYMNKPAVGQYFKPEILHAMLESAVLMPLISQAVLHFGTGKAKLAEQSWVHREIHLRRTIFDQGKENIIPVQLPGGQASMVVEGITPIVARTEDEIDEAITSAIRRVREIKSSAEPIPCATRRTPLPKDFR